MARLNRLTHLRVLLRSFAVQGSWNYESLIGTGFGFALLPALRKIYAERPESLRDALERHSKLFNSHPYVTPVALGAIIALEAEQADPRLIDRFKAAVRGSLGVVGDRLIWAGWRPVCLLGAMALLLLGAPWWVGICVFLVIYNIGHVVLRIWSYRLGLTEGIAVAESLRGSFIGSVSRRLGSLGAFLLGLVIPLALGGGILSVSGAAAGASMPLGWVAAAVVGAAVGLRWGQAVRTPAALALFVLVFSGILVKALL